MPEVKPERDRWCRHADPGHGCKIYRERPQACRAFVCQWLMDERWPERWFPARAGIVITHSRGEDGVMRIGFVVDPARPWRWREQPWLDDIKAIAAKGMREGFQTYIVLKGEHIPIRP